MSEAATYPEVMIDAEAAEYLRLDVGREMPAAIKALHRLEDQGRLVSLRYQKSRVYSLAELRRFLEREADSRGGATR